MSQSVPDHKISVLILARNESLHIRRCIESARLLTPHVHVVDSDSTDGTADIARAMGAQVFTANFDRFSDKLNWALSQIDYPTPWVMRLDADEVLTPSLLSGLPELLANVGSDISGIHLRRQLWFMGQWIRHGGMFPTYSLRVWRKGHMRCEVRDLDEHMILTSGRSIQSKLDLIDNPLYDLDVWINKHNRYASLEAKTEVTFSTGADLAEGLKPKLMGSWAERHRWLKQNAFYRLPLFVRPWLYFLYRYVLLLGFLDGKAGFLFHFMHGLWYRMLVDGKVLEMNTSKQGRHKKDSP